MEKYYKIVDMNFQVATIKKGNTMSHHERLEDLIPNHVNSLRKLERDINEYRLTKTNISDEYVEQYNESITHAENAISFIDTYLSPIFELIKIDEALNKK